MKIKVWLAELRAPFFTASIVPVLLGTAVAWHATHEFHLLYFLAALIGGMLLHAGANVSNDYYDHRSGCDSINDEFVRPFTGGSRMIQNGAMTPKEVLAEAIICYILAAVIGVWLAYELGPVILLLGLIGAVSGFFYTAPPFKFVSHGIGEVMIGLNFGVLMTLGAYFVQTGELSLTPVVASLPIAILITLVLYINEFTDYNADKASGKMHIVARLGRKKSAVVYIVLICLAYTAVFAGIALKMIPVWGIAAVATLPIAYRAVKTAFLHHDQPQELVPANASTIMLHLFMGLILSGSYIISGVL